MPPRILLADDHVIVRQGFRALLEREGLEVVAEAANGHEAVRLAGELLPDVAVLDFAMPLLNGLDAAKEIRRCSPRTRVGFPVRSSPSHPIPYKKRGQTRTPCS